MLQSSDDVYYIFILFGFIYALYNTGSFYLEGKVSKNWPTAVGHIIRSEVTTHYDEATSYSLNIEFEYNINGIDYVSNRIRIGSSWSVDGASKSTKYEIQKKYLVGDRVTVYYNPSQLEQKKPSPLTGLGYFVHQIRTLNHNDAIQGTGLLEPGGFHIFHYIAYFFYKLLIGLFIPLFLILYLLPILILFFIQAFLWGRFIAIVPRFLLMVEGKSTLENYLIWFLIIAPPLLVSLLEYFLIVRWLWKRNNRRHHDLGSTLNSQINQEVNKIISKTRGFNLTNKIDRTNKIKCEGCGEQTETDSRYCTHCGSYLTNSK